MPYKFNPFSGKLDYYEPSGSGSGDVATDPIWNAKGDLAVGTGSDTAQRLGVGANGEVLTADSAETTGVKWAAVAGTGDVTSTSNLTDNAIVRGDGGAKGIQTSGITIDDSDNISGINNVTGADANLATGTAGTSGNLASWNADGDIVDSTITATSVSALVANTSGTNTGDVTVSDTSEIDLTLTGQLLSAAIVSGSVDEAKLDTSVNASLDLADSAVQNLADLSITATASELNTLDGITATVTELNYTDGVTSAIQTQLNAKQAQDAFLDDIAALTDPNADRLMFWDDSAGELVWLTAGTGLSITGTTIAATGGGSGFTWSEVTGTSQSAAVNTGYVANNAGLVTITLPTTAAVGNVVEVVGKGAGGWRVAQNASEQILGTRLNTTVGTGGYLQSTESNDGVRLVCITADTTWQAYFKGNVTVV